VHLTRSILPPGETETGRGPRVGMCRSPFLAQRFIGVSVPISLPEAEESYIQTALHEPSPIRADGVLCSTTARLPRNRGGFSSELERLQGRRRGKREQYSKSSPLSSWRLRMCWERGSGWMEDRVHRFLARLSFSFWCVGLANDCKANQPAACPHLSSVASDNMSHDMTIILNQCLSHPSLHLKDLGNIP
jgi:hypothetical protein